MAEIIVREVHPATEGVWSFRDSTVMWRHGRYGSAGTFDPFPAYRHDVQVVRHTAEQVAQMVPPLWDVELFVADREEVGRSNGYSNVHQEGHSDDAGRWVRDSPTGLIVLSGKRIPPHPAVTRYLVAHEYGHNVEWMINHVRGGDKALQSDVTVEAYAKLRGLPVPIHAGSGGRWHDSAAEVFACDFRILVCQVEPEFWPHPGVPHPRDLPDLWPWWKRALDDLHAARPTVPA